MEDDIKSLIKDVVEKVVSKEISTSGLRELIQTRLDSRKLWDCNNMLITDCYFALKHIEEEAISLKEWEYFLECLSGKREYKVKDKFDFISGQDDD